MLYKFTAMSTSMHVFSFLFLIYIIIIIYCEVGT
jgi:hypothetical protein